MIVAAFVSCGPIKPKEEYLREAYALEDKQAYNSAIKILDDAIVDYPDYKPVLLSRGADKAALGDYKGAIADYSKVIKLDPKNTLALYNTGNNYKRLSKYLIAIDFYNKAFKSKGGESFYFDRTPNGFAPQDNFDVPGHEIFYERGLAYYNVDSVKKAYNDLKQSIKSNYKADECYYYMGFLYLEIQKKEIACKCFQKSAQLGYADAEKAVKKYCNTPK